MVFDSRRLNHALMAVMLAFMNPLTYRGYQYDIETGLYYLQSRYYNPTYGRFINGDDSDILKETLGILPGANLFAYCANDPVNDVDQTGEISGALISSLLLLSPEIIVLLACGLYVIAIAFIYLIDSNFRNAFNECVVSIYGNANNSFGILISIAISLFSLIEVGTKSLINDIRKRVKNNKKDHSYEKHHIVPRKITFDKTFDPVIVNYYLINTGIDIDDPLNTIMLKVRFHRALNTNVYYSYVYRLTQAGYGAGKSFLGEYGGRIGVQITLMYMQILLGFLNTISPQ
ncbi:MAG: hypothetical protein GX051_10220 [Clostridiales bacterium]|nr:hypothetical protein [Clostridiales bacterium]